METILAPGRRSLPPVPRPAGAPSADHASARRLGHGLAGHARRLGRTSRRSSSRGIRSAAADFAAAAGAVGAVVCEAVPPARHRRARCRLVLQYADGAERDLTFLGAAGNPTRARLGFDRQIQRWLRAGQPRDAGWLVVDADAADGVAVDVPAWLAAAGTAR